MNTTCPKCDSDMSPVPIDEVVVDRCNGCGGIWFDLREHDNLKKRDKASRVDRGDPATGNSFNAIRDIDCPHCKQKMVKLAFPNQPHIHYEQCNHCGGAFLDAGEFTDLATLTASERFKTWWSRVRLFKS